MSEKAERGELKGIAGTAQYGEEASAAGRALLMEATETTTVEDAMAVALGRPQLGAEPNAIMKTRVPKPLLAQVRQIADERSTTVSEIVREAMNEYVKRMAV